MPIPGTQQVQIFQKQFPRSVNSNYLLYLPKDYNTQQEKYWPFILSLHGAGERGNNLDRVRSQGLPRKLQNLHDFPFIVVSPQCLSTASWYDDVLNALLDEMESTYRVDTDRIYVTGLSMGGFGTWSLAITYPDRFAAIAPICGGGVPETVCAIKHVPVWTFHGARDSVVPIKYTEAMVEALKNCGGDVRFTVYPHAGHDSWTQTYANPQLYDWFLEHTRYKANVSSQGVPLRSPCFSILDRTRTGSDTFSSSSMYM